jgi:anti-sigma B factor antagonist
MLSVTIYRLGEVAVFRCAGRITADRGDALEAAVWAQANIRVAVLDLAGIRAVDAHGLGILVSLLIWSRTTHKRLKLSNLQPRVEEVLALTNLLSEFEVCAAEEPRDSHSGIAS